MIKKKTQKVGSVKSQTTFLQNGMVLADPIDGEYIKLPSELCGLFRSRVEITQDGMCVIKLGGRPGMAPARYYTPFCTAHSKVKVTKEDVIIEHRFPRRLDNKLLLQYYEAEKALVKAFIAAQKDSKNW